MRIGSELEIATAGLVGESMHDQHDADNDDEHGPGLIPRDVCDAHGIELEDGARKNQDAAEDPLATIVAGGAFTESDDDEHNGPEARATSTGKTPNWLSSRTTPIEITAMPATRAPRPLLRSRFMRVLRYFFGAGVSFGAGDRMSQ